MTFKKCDIEGLLVIEAKVWGDERGFFLETFRESVFKEAGVKINWCQDNWSRSSKNVLRGLHYQKAPRAQAKLVRVMSGAIWDVAVDLRPESPTYTKHFGLELSEDNKKAILIPEGFAHGFCVLSDSADLVYKCSDEFEPCLDAGIIWNDSDLDVPWPIENPLVSEKDKNLPSFQGFVRDSK